MGEQSPWHQGISMGQPSWSMESGAGGVRDRWGPCSNFADDPISHLGKATSHCHLSPPLVWSEGSIVSYPAKRCDI